MAAGCPFCSPDPDAVILRNEKFLAFPDRFPVSSGHTLIVSVRHAASFFDLDGEERNSLLDLLEETRSRLDADHRPDGFNIGWNESPAGGQTVMHFHLHVIPRYAGDQDDPRGGLRWIFPERAPYWEQE